MPHASAPGLCYYHAAIHPHAHASHYTQAHTHARLTRLFHSYAGSRLSLFQGYFERYQKTCAPECVDCYRETAFLNNMSPAALAIAFCDSRPFVTSTIIGATSREQLEVNLQGFGVEWTDDLEAEIARIHNYYPDPWRMIIRDGG